MATKTKSLFKSPARITLLVAALFHGLVVLGLEFGDLGVDLGLVAGKQHGGIVHGLDVATQCRALIPGEGLLRVSVGALAEFIKGRKAILRRGETAGGRLLIPGQGLGEILHSPAPDPGLPMWCDVRWHEGAEGRVKRRTSRERQSFGG